MIGEFLVNTGKNDVCIARIENNISVNIYRQKFVEEMDKMDGVYARQVVKPLQRLLILIQLNPDLYFIKVNNVDFQATLNFINDLINSAENHPKAHVNLVL